jgi:methylation protein EvaC
MGLANYEVIIEANSRFQLQAKVLKDLLTKLKFEGNSIVGYGATSKSATILNYSNIGAELLDYICDTTESKQGLYSPGKHIPIVPYEYFTSNHVDYVLLFAWNHKNEIFEKEKSSEKNFKWILPFPFPEILDKNA